MSWFFFTQTHTYALQVNCIAPLFLSKALLPLLQAAATTNASCPIGVSRSAIVMMSTAVGSIAENTGGGIVAYRVSKTALNMAMKGLAIELKSSGILVLSMHPGWVKTDMGGPNALIDTETCCSTMLQTFAALSEADHGEFLRYNNTRIPW